MDKDTSDVVLPIIVGSFGIVVFVTVFWWFDRRSKVILQKWAEEHGFKITWKKQRYMIFTGPFKFWTNSRNQIIYHFTVQDRDKHERSGWARCGSYFGGVFFSDKIEVRWDEHEPSHANDGKLSAEK
jgi:hypothetical protein